MMTETLAAPPKATHQFRRVAILFAGGPPPGANAVISTAAISFLKSGSEVLGMKHGYSSLIDYSSDEPLQEGRDWVHLTPEFMKRSRSSQGILIGTARANPGKLVSSPDHLDDPDRSAPLKNVYEGLRPLGVEALISIGGDDTLKTANKFKMFQDRLPAGSPRIPVVHLPKTIDNDYMGIDFTFGYFTAVDTLATELRNLIYDAEAARAYFLSESMGRSARAGWAAVAAAAVVGVAFSGSVAAQEKVLRIAMTAADIPRTLGQPDQGFEGNRFTGIPMYDALTHWDLSKADAPSVLIPGLASSS